MIRGPMPADPLRSLPKTKAAFVEPMDCVPVPKLPEGSEWVWEIKLDGYRALAVKSGNAVTLYSRNRKILNKRFPYIVEPLANLPAGIVVDGELVAIVETDAVIWYPANPRSNERKEKSMKLVFIAMFFMGGFLLSSWGESQKHTSGITQCRSDAAAWNKEEDTGPKDKDVGYRLPFGELLKRQREMMDCVKLDGGVRTSYRTIYHVYTTAMYARYQHFLERNQLMEKFLDEDSKGSR